MTSPSWDSVRNAEPSHAVPDATASKQPPAMASFALVRDGHVADFTCEPAAPMYDPAIGDHLAADTCRYGDEHQRSRAAAGAEMPFAESGGVAIILQPHSRFNRS